MILSNTKDIGGLEKICMTVIWGLNMFLVTVGKIVPVTEGIKMLLEI